jgi:xanthine/uracil permease
MVYWWLYFIGIVLSLAFIGWLIWRAAKKKAIKAYMAMYGLSCMAGIFTLAFFLSMDISTMIKILVCIIFGVILIFIGARLQQRAKAD